MQFNNQKDGPYLMSPNPNGRSFLPLGEIELLIRSVTKEKAKTSGNDMYVITLIDDGRQFEPVKDYFVFIDNDKTVFSKSSKYRIEYLLKRCKVDTVEKLVGYHIIASIIPDKIRIRKVEYYR